jgi:hypothetical protein
MLGRVPQRQDHVLGSAGIVLGQFAFHLGDEVFRDGIRQPDLVAAKDVAVNTSARLAGADDRRTRKQEEESKNQTRQFHFYVP